MKTGYDTIDEAYRDLMPELIFYAKTHLFNRDYAVDAANEAFDKCLEYISKNRSAKVSSFYIVQELKRVCRRYNKKYSSFEYEQSLIHLIDDEENTED